jgi:hypothetical protein
MSLYYRTLIQGGLLLDTYPNAAVAYSLRKLRDGYKKVFNLLSYSEDISQATYTKSALITTGTPPYIDVATSPNGTLTADKLIENTSFTTHFLTQTLGITVVGLDYNFSVYLKAGERTKTDIQAGGVGQARINLLTGAIETSTFPITPIVTDTGNGWWRFSVTFIASSTVINPLYRIFTVNNLNQSSYVGDGVSGVYVWGFQLTQSSSVLPYEKTVVAPDNGNAIEVRRSSDSAELDIPFNTNGELDTDILLDFVGWNLFAWSEQLQQTYWAKTNLTVTTDTLVAPDGNTTGDVLFETTTNGVHSFQRSLALTNGQLYTVSFWIKNEGRNNVRITTSSNFSQDGTGGIAWLDLSLGTIVSQNSGFSGANLTLTPDGDWYKVSYTMPALVTGSITVLQLNLSPNGSNVSYVGNTSLGIAVWGLQLTESSTIRPYRQTLAIGEGQGSVSTWYDQSGNGRNASQGAVSLQASIVVNGNLITNNGKVSTLWSSDSYLFTAINTNVPIVSTYVARRNGTGTSGQMTSFANNGTTIATVFRLLSNNNMVTYLNTARVHSPGDTFTGDYLLTTYKRVDEYVSIRKNSVEFANAGISTGNGALNSFGNGVGSGTTGYVNEGILWFQDYVSLIPNIETEINNYYGIY